MILVNFYEYALLLLIRKSYTLSLLTYGYMQAKLPDVNARLVRYMNSAQNAYDRKDFSKAAISFEASIALLPEDYQPEINTNKYADLVRNKYNIVCDSCKAEHKRGDIIPYRLLLTNIGRLVSGQEIVKVWKCPSCSNVRELKGSQTKVIKFYQPSYFGVIPEPPVREGMHDRIGFESRFKKWFDIATREIEHKVGLYRTEYAAQQDSVMETIPDE